MKKFISEKIAQRLGHEPTEGQREMMEKLAEFIVSPENDTLFLLKGYAGTGKTSSISALVQVLEELKIRFVLLAPTGRAAKVLSGFSGKPASTIHKKIYRQQSLAGGETRFALDRNLNRNTLFIVDEASMISNLPQENGFFGSGYLLSDLIEYVMGGLGCKLILSGDTAQLPPVGLDLSPALEPGELKLFDLEVVAVELKEVVRQSLDSGILANATVLRNRIREESPTGFWEIMTHGRPDVVRIGGDQLIEEISQCYDRLGMEQTMIVTRSNKRANLFNEGIRRTILYKEEQVTRGDLVMVVRNTYYWSNQCNELEFIANGDIAEVVRIRK
ncbi:MAG: AAA family ATPase, partial [Marinilabiliales bacterium]|nr:AAA family ATPase [Marinilabiliales bacterium]